VREARETVVAARAAAGDGVSDGSVAQRDLDNSTPGDDARSWLGTVQGGEDDAFMGFLSREVHGGF
jgi:hypothetical protein